MTKECTICSDKVSVPCSSLGHEFFRDSCARACLLRQRDSRDAQIRHLKSQLSRLSTATPSSPPSAEPPPTSDLSASTLLNWAETVLMNVSLLESQPIVLRQWLKHIQATDYNLSLAVAWGIQKAILDAITVAYVRYSGSTTASGPTSQSPKASPNPTDAKWDGALVDEIGAEVTNPFAWSRGEGLASQDGTPLSTTLKWTEGEHTIFDDNGQYGIFQSGRGWSCKYYNQLLGWHLDLASAKSDCEVHHLTTKDNKAEQR